MWARCGCHSQVQTTRFGWRLPVRSPAPTRRHGPIILISRWASILVVFSGLAIVQQRFMRAQAIQYPIAAAFGNLPLTFEENHGQSDARIRFLARGAGYSLFLMDAEAVFAFSVPSSAVQLHSTSLSERSAGRWNLPGVGGWAAPEHGAGVRKTSILRMGLAGARSRVQVAGEEPLPGTINYFLGNDPAKWRSGIPTYAQVRYSRVYPGVDLVYYGNRQRMEYDFVVAPGTDTRQIRLRVEGAKNIALTRSGDLTISSEGLTVSFHKPAIYQTVNGKRVPVEGSFTLLAGHTVGFRVTLYDHTKPLVIDPVLSYSTLVAGSDDDTGITGIAVNAAGEAFVTGWTAGPGFPSTLAAFQGTNPVPGNSYAPFVAKLNATGTALEYATFVSGTTATSAINGIAIDSANNAYIVGATAATDFPTTPGAFQTTNNAHDNQTGFIAKVNSTGTALVYSTYLGGSITSNPTHNGGQDSVNAIALDSAGNAYLTGFTVASDFPVTNGAFQTNYPAGNQGGVSFATKMNAAGSALVYSTLLGGSVLDHGLGIALDSAGNAYIAGTTSSSDFPITPGAFQSVNRETAGYTGTVTKVNPTGTALVYSTYLGGSGGEGVASIAVDSAGNAYVTGGTVSHDFPVTPGAFQTSITPTTYQATFITKMNASNNALIYSTFLSGSYSDEGISIAIDAAGTAYVAGESGSTDFPITPGAFQTINEAWLVSLEPTTTLTKLNPSGTALLYSTYLGGSGDETGYNCDCVFGLALDPAGNVYVAGRASSEDYPTTPGVFLTTLEADGGQPPYGFAATNAFVVKFNADQMASLPISITNVTANANPQLVTYPITFTAHVVPASGSPMPTGAIGFDLDDFVWTTATLDGRGSATYSPPSNLMYWGTHTISALYMGDASNAPSLGGLTETVDLIPSSVAVSSSTSSALYGTPVTFNVTVTATPPTPIPSGTIDVYVGGNRLATTSLDANGQASFTTSALPAGTDVLQVDYSDRSFIHQNATTTIIETIQPLGTVPAPSFSPPAGTYTSIQSVTLGDTMAGAAIQYTTDGSDPNGSTAKVYSVPFTVQSTETVKAVATAAGYSASSVASALYTINLPPPDFGLAITPSSETIQSGQDAGANITVTPLNGFWSTITFSCTGAPAGYSCNLSPQAANPQGDVLQVSVEIAPTSSAANGKQQGMPLLALASLALGALWLRQRRGRFGAYLLLLAAVVTSAGLLSTCGGGGTGGGGTNPQPQPTTSTVTISATSGSLTHQVQLTLTVD